jgi:hypothetical protein
MASESASALLSDQALLSTEQSWPRVTVSLHELTVTRQSRARALQPSTLPASLAAAAGALLNPCGARGAVPLAALSRVSARFAAGSATLVLGSPGSGKSTLLRAVAGRLDGGGGGEAAAVRYNGVPLPGLAAERGLQPRRLAAYAPQVDQHQAFLTVRELLSFAHASSAAALPAGASPAAARSRRARRRCPRARRRRRRARRARAWTASSRCSGWASARRPSSATPSCAACRAARSGA